MGSIPGSLAPHRRFVSLLLVACKFPFRPARSLARRKLLFPSLRISLYVCRENGTMYLRRRRARFEIQRCRTRRDARRAAPVVLLVSDRCSVATAAGTEAIACPREMYCPSGWIPRDCRYRGTNVTGVARTFRTRRRTSLPGN